MRVKSKIALLSALVCLSATANAVTTSDNVYQIKADFIESMDSAASVHSKDATLRRNNLISVLEKTSSGVKLSESDKVFIENVSKRIGVSPSDTDSIVLMTDKVPTSIIIAVAIKESVWGTEKTMSKAHNLFGIRCFKLGCGVADNKSKEEGLYSELMVFSNDVDAARFFAKNINTNTTLSEFREARKLMRDNGDYLTSLPLAEYLSPYSGDKKNYGREIRKIIHDNKLYYLDE
jgi:uncharacterized FlgJ-related protein